MQNKTLISREHRSKYCNPNSPRHCGHYVSPIPDANSSIYDTELEAHEKNLSQREEEYLIDLKNFFDGVEIHRKFKLELDEFEKQLKEPVFSLEKTEEGFLDIKKMLDDRAKKAELINSIPISDFSDESQKILELENEVIQLEKSAESPLSDKVISVAKMLSDTQEIEYHNVKFSEELKQRKLQIEELKNKLNNDYKNIEVIEKDEERMNSFFLKDKAILDSLPELTLEEILFQERLKADLQSRKEKTVLQYKNLKINTNKANDEVNKLKIEIQNLEKEFMLLNENESSIKILLEQIHKVNQINSRLYQSLEETDESLKRFMHTYENQNNDIFLIKQKKDDIIKKLNDDIKKKKILDEKEQMLKQRKEELSKIEYNFKLDRDELNKMKKRISEIEIDVEKHEKSAKSMIDKVNEAQEQLQELNIEFFDSSSTSSMKDLKDLINNIDN